MSRLRILSSIVVASLGLVLLGACGAESLAGQEVGEVVLNDAGDRAINLDGGNDDSSLDAETLRAELFDSGEVNLGGFIVDSISESQPDVLFRNFGGCFGDRTLAFGVYVDVDVVYEFGDRVGNSKYGITASTEPGVADGSTRGDVPVTVLVQSLGDIANPDDDRNIEGPGTMTIGEPIVMDEEPFFRGTPYVITATLDVDGQPLEVSLVETIDVVCN